MICFSIEILDDVFGLPSEMYDGASGGSFVELSNDSALTLEDTREELNDINEIKIDSIIDITVPQTPKNDLLFGSWFKNGVLDRVYEPMCIQLLVGSIPTKQRYIYPVSKNDESCTYQLKVTWNKEHWAIAQSECNICDIEHDFNDFELNKDNIMALCDNDEWQDGDPLYMWIPVYSGEDLMSNPRYLTVQDFRPVWNLYGLTKALFKKTGWCLDSPLLECPEFRCLWTYESGEFNIANIDLDSLKFLGCKDSIIPTSANTEVETIDFDEIILDNHFDGQKFVRSGVYTFKLNGTAEGYQGSTLTELTFEVIKECGTNIQVVSTFVINGDGDFDFETPPVTIDSSCCIYVRYKTNVKSLNPDGIIGIEIIDLCFSNCPIRAVYEEGDIIDMKSTLDCTLSALDRLKGILHLINGKITENQTTKTISIRPPYNVKCIDGTIIEGFNTGETIDISDSIVCNSLITKTPSYDKERYCLYGFKKSSDEAIKEIIGDDETQPFDYVSDLGKSYQDRTKEKRNPYFEPTINVELPQYGAPAPLHLPSIQDTTPRVFFVKCGIQNYIQIDGGALIAGMKFGDDLLSSFPNIFQDYNYENFDVYDENTLNEIDPNLLSGYESNYLNYYKKEEFNRNGANALSIDFCMDAARFRSIDFRKRVCFNYNGCAYDVTLDEKSYEACDSIGTLIGGEERKTLDCSDSLGDPTGDGSGDPDPICNNNPEVECVLNGNCYELSISGTESPILNTIWEYRLCDPDTAWTTLTNLTTETAELCDLPRTAKIRVQVIFDDDCPSLYAPIKVIDGCQNEPEYIWECYLNSNGQTCFKITLGGTIESLIDTHVYTLNIDGVVTPYTLGDEYCFPLSQAGQQISVTINGDITYSDSCDPSLDLESIKDFPPNEIECELTDAIAVCVPTDVEGCFTFEHTGNFATNQAWIGYKIVCDGEEYYWTNADEPFCCTTDFEVYLVVLFCTTCPTYCQSIPTICAVDLVCPTGTASLSCDACILTINISGYAGYQFTLTDPLGGNLGVVTDGMTFDISADGIGIDGIYTLTGLMDTCPDVIHLLTHDVTYAGVSGSTEIII